MELSDLRHLSQDQLLKLINAATALLEYDNYPETHLFINGRNFDTELSGWWDPSK